MMKEKEYIKNWNLWCERYDPENLELKYIKEITDIKNKSILEIGCGNGRFTRILAKEAKKVIGIDNDKTMIKAAKQFPKRDNTFYKFMNALELNIKEKFDIIIFTWSLVVMHKKEEIALSLASKHLKEDGRLILIEPGGKSDYGTIVRPFLPKTISSISIKESYEKPLKKIFKSKLSKTGPIKIPYKFKSNEEAFDVFMFAIEEWHHHSLNTEEKNKLMKIIENYNKEIFESVYFYGVIK